MPSAAQMRLEVRAQHLRRDEPERVVVGARADGGEHLVRLGGGEDEDQEVRRFLDELEQRVERRRRDHVRLVDDVDLEAVADRGEERPLAQVAGVVDAVVAGGVDLDDVDGARAVGRELAARVAHAARVGRRALRAVQRAGQDARAGGLAAAARAAEQVGVVDAAGRERRAQRLGDVVLADDLGEGGRAVLAVQREIARGRWRGVGLGFRRRSAGHPTTLTSRHRHAATPVRTPPDVEGPPAHPPEPAYPCCLPALGRFAG